MRPVRVSPKFQIVIPQEVRESMGIKAGEEMQVFECDGRIEVVPVRSIKEFRGRFKGINTHVERDEDRV